MLDISNFNYIINLSDKNFFIKKKKKIKFINKLSVYYNYRKINVNLYSKFKDYWYMFMRFESLFGSLPKIDTFKTRRKGKTKKIIFLRAFITLKSFSVNSKVIENVLNYVFSLHNYLYIKFLLNKRHRVVKMEETTNHFTKLFFIIQQNSIEFENNLYFKWLDIGRNFINLEKLNVVYKQNFQFFSMSRRLRHYNSKFIINSFYFKFFISFFRILVKNYRKLIVFFFKKFRSKKKSEKAYILL